MLTPLSTAELQAILERDRPDNVDSKVYSNFVTLFLSVFQKITNNLTEMRRMIGALFPIYIEPVLQGRRKSYLALATFEFDRADIWC